MNFFYILLMFITASCYGPTKQSDTYQLSINDEKTISCKSQSHEFSLTGKWLCVEEHGSDGARDFIKKVTDGEILIFGSDNTVMNERGIKGLYDLKGESLHIEIPNNEKFYIITKFKDDFKKLSLTPTTPKYEIMCDEGCAFIYQKQDNE